VSDIEAGDGSDEGAAASAAPVAFIEDSARNQTFDLGNAFTKLQAARQETKSRPPAQDFRLSLKDEGTVSMDLFERIKQDREAEVARAEEALLQQQQKQQQQQRTLQQGQQQGQQLALQGQGQRQTQQTYADATDMFSRSSKRAAEEAEAAFAERERKALEARASSSQIFTNAPPPDMRALFMGDKQGIDRTLNRAGGNPTLVPDSRTTTGSQILIVPERDTMAYKEVELNLFVYSGDRDWVTNSTETRYNFSVNFDPAYIPATLRIAPSSTMKFRNITRIELVKAIVPGEGLDVMVSKSGASAYDSSVNMNVLSYPYIQVRIPELDNNVYGTNLGINAAFGVLQYDANWISDTGISTQRGFLAMIPKFLKCQKVYSPTPLSTLQKLSFRFERPDGTLLSKAPDTLDITRIFPTIAMTSPFPYSVANSLTNTYYKKDAIDVNSSAYYWLQTSTYFNHWTVSKGDRIVVKNLHWGSEPQDDGAKQMPDFLSYIQQDAGLIVVDTGYITGTDAASYVFTSETATTSGYNSQGYANAIIVRGSFVDPTTGSTEPVSFGGVPDEGNTLVQSLSTFLKGTPLALGRLLNQTHQVQVSMRIITRELDSTGIIRPDNM